MTAPQFAAWLFTMLMPFSVIGSALVVAGHYYDGEYTPQARRVFGGLIAALIVAMVAGLALSYHAEIYDQCNDPQYVNTWWWYAWGCYLR